MAFRSVTASPTSPGANAAAAGAHTASIACPPTMPSGARN